MNVYGDEDNEKDDEEDEGLKHQRLTSRPSPTPPRTRIAQLQAQKIENRSANARSSDLVKDLVDK